MIATSTTSAAIVPKMIQSHFILPSFQVWNAMRCIRPAGAREQFETAQRVAAFRWR
jgi:hypothetical protein